MFTLNMKVKIKIYVLTYCFPCFLASAIPFHPIKILMFLFGLIMPGNLGFQKVKYAKCGLYGQVCLPHLTLSDICN